MKRILFIGWNCFYLFEDKNVFYVEKIHKIKRKRLIGPYVIKRVFFNKIIDYWANYIDSQDYKWQNISIGIS